MNRLEELSKEISYALRHAPWEYELEMDQEGWVPVEQLLDALHRAEKWNSIGEADLKEMIEKSEKKRHELKDGRIRAFYIMEQLGDFLNQLVKQSITSEQAICSFIARH